MSQTTVKQLATQIGISVEMLLVRLQQAGVTVSGKDAELSEQDRWQLLRYLRNPQRTITPSPAEPEKVTLNRKTVTELKQPVPNAPRGPAQARTQSVSVEVRKRRTYVKRPSDLPERSSAEAEAQRLAAEAEARRLAAEAEAQRLAAEAEAQRLAAEAEAQRLAAEAEARRLAAEAEAQRLAAEAEAQRLAAEAAQPAPGTKPAEAAQPPESAGTRRKKAMQDELPAQDEVGSTLLPKLRKPLPAKEPIASKPHRPAAGASNDKGATQWRQRGGEAEARPQPGSHNKSRSQPKKGGKFPSNQPAGRRPDPRQTQTHGFERPVSPVVREVIIPETITVAELAGRMSVKVPEVIKILMKLGIMATINQVLDQDTSVLVVEEMGHKAQLASPDDPEAEWLQQQQAQHEHDEALRAPVVTIMGHVDHGKTSLLDYIRRTRVAAGEAGGITQHIGAYLVSTPKGKVCFLDTPGHAAFTAMRARGAKATDIVVLVVAADDGVMPQTIEAIQHAQAAKVPVVVAVNKIDKPGAQPEHVRQELLQHNVIAEEFGGDTLFVNVSAKTGQGVDALLEALALQSEIMELQAPTEGMVKGVVIEASLDRGRGPVATVLVQRGTLRKGDMVLAGREYGRVRAMLDEQGRPLEAAGPSTPVVILGLSGVPAAGDDMLTTSDERKAREIALFRQGKFRDTKIGGQPAKLEDMFAKAQQEGQTKTLNLLVKADFQGSVEALRPALEQLSTAEVQIRVIGSGVGGITESDVNLAHTASASILGFNVRADGAARALIEEKGVELLYYSIIYNLLDDVKLRMTGLLEPKYSEKILGTAEVREVFHSKKLGAIAGCRVVEGVLRRNNPIRVLRDNIVIFEGALESLRRFKEDVLEVKADMECGIGVKNYNDVKPGDRIEVFERVREQRTL